MKAVNKKALDAFDIMLEQREQLNEKLSKMSKKEIIEYYRKKKLDNSIIPDTK